MSIPSPQPLYPVYNALTQMTMTDYPELQTFLQSGQAWRQQHWQWGRDFLRFIGRNKSEHTYVRFRNEVERWVIDDLRVQITKCGLMSLYLKGLYAEKRRAAS